MISFAITTPHVPLIMLLSEKKLTSRGGDSWGKLTTKAHLFVCFVSFVYLVLCATFLVPTIITCFSVCWCLRLCTTFPLPTTITCFSACRFLCGVCVFFWRGGGGGGWVILNSLVLLLPVLYYFVCYRCANVAKIMLVK